MLCPVVTKAASGGPFSVQLNNPMNNLTFMGPTRFEKVLKALFTALTAICLVVGIGISNASGGDEQIPMYVESEILIKYKPHVSRAAQEAYSTQFGARRLGEFRSVGVHQLELPPGVSVEEGIKMFRLNPDVEYVEPNYIRRISAIPNDPFFSKLWGLNNTGRSGTTDADIDAPEAWDISTGSDTVVVAVIDTGVDYKHPDLKANIWTNPGDPSGGGDNDDNGYIDDIRGWDFVDGDSNPMDLNGHGTRVAGILGAVGNNATGVTGVAWSVKIMPLRVLDAKGIGSVADEIAAINYARENGAHIINASLVGTSFSQAEKDAIEAFGSAGGLFVAAAGNSGDDNDRSPTYPASHPSFNIIAVAATTQTDALLTYSNFGQASVDLGAPGAGIMSTLPDDKYGFISGTSAATPHVAGTAALLKAKSPALTNLELKDDILKSVDTVSSLSGKVATGGRLNAAAALARILLEQQSPPPTLSPTPSSEGGGEEGGGGCFIATAAYGGPHHPDLDTLRDFRDKRLLTNSAGRAFVRFYYRYSPPLAEYVSKHPALRLIVKIALMLAVFAIRHPQAGALLVVIVYCLVVLGKRRVTNKISRA